MQAQDLTSTRPYLIRALYEWCCDNGLTPHIVVRVNNTVQVPNEFVNDGEIVLNVSPDATNALQMGNDFIEFKARFGGRPHDIMVPVRRVIAIYARETGQGMAFPLEDDIEVQSAALESDQAAELEPARSVPRLQSVDSMVNEETAPPQASPNPPSTPPRPPKGGGGRPALKRIK